MTERPLVGVVLAGGRSRRFGRDKREATLRGRSLLEWAVEALGPNVDDVLVVLPASGGEGPARVRVRRDAREDAGPLEGMRVALEWAGEEGAVGVVVVACDLPLLGAGGVAALASVYRARGAKCPDGVIPRVAGRLQPLAAAYHPRVLEEVEARLRAEGGERSLRAFLRDLRVAHPDAESLGLAETHFLNVNEPADLRRAEAILLESPGAGRAGVEDTVSPGTGVRGVARGRG